MKDEYDVLVVGAGPAGSIAAKTAAEAGLSVLLIEKRPAIGVPVRCAEGVSIDGLKEFIEPDKKWISSEFKNALIVGPDGSKFKVSKGKDETSVGYVLDRKIFDRELAWKAAEAGAEVQVHARASAPIIVNGKVQGAVIHQHGVAYEVRAKIIIAADGIESKFAKWAGINTTVPLGELEPCAQYIINDIDIDESQIQFYFSFADAPFGYIWVFPKGKRCANVGIGIGGTKSGDGHRARDYLDKFVKEKFPNGKITELIVGGVSVCKPLETTATDNMMIVGDAARLADPMTGGGIYNAMFSGKLAAETAIEAIKAGNTSKAMLLSYDRKWRMSKMGKSLVRNYAIKEVFIKLDDAKLNSLMHSMSDISLDELNVKALVMTIMKSNPWIIRELPTIMKSL